ncbi:hypothetical protein P691DRAFT_788599 [Macrolepiota fuliginosa MF-IS2]|uniref:F-box domain-containing protein n=1 Tax=Macrolepiota fuliginosa MF-IS2 TaxID=1400762 RepID=A0A9P5X2B8_9AGAR|nr:hypothetical protein P691DRAFT_788599 [Macrolepiota fuliginosa MF-IS2]
MPQATIQSQPNEILSGIFLSLIDHVWEAHSKMTVGEVRTNCPTFGTISSSPLQSSGPASRPRSSIVNLLLERSGQLPLELDLDFLPYLGDEDSAGHIAVLMGILRGTIHRWQKVTLRLGNRFSNSILIYPFSDATHLTHMNIIFPDNWLDPQVGEFLIQSLGDAPVLSHLEYCGLDRFALEELMDMPRVNRLTTLRLDVSYYLDLESAIHVFNECPCVTWISLTCPIRRMKFMDIAAWPKLYLPNLCILEIGETWLLPLFHCPNLQVFSVVSSISDSELEQVLVYISTYKHSLQVVRSQVARCYLAWFFSNEVLVRIPIVEVKATMSFNKAIRDEYQREILDGMWEMWGDSREPTSFTTDDAELTIYFGWVDPKVLPLYREYFSGTRKIVLPPGPLSLYY